MLEQLFVGALVGMNLPRWPRLARAMAKARAGDASEFLTKLALPPPEEWGNLLGVTLCHDFMSRPPSYQEFQAIEKRLKAAAPRFGWIEGRNQLGRCVGISGRPAYEPRPLRAPGLPPVLIGIGELDNNTTHMGAQHVAAQLRQARALWHGDGHAAYFLHGDNCLNQHVLAYLTDKKLPPAGTRCPGAIINSIPDRPAGS